MVRIVLVLVLLCSLAPLHSSAQWYSLWGSDDDDVQEEDGVVLEDPVLIEPEVQPGLETVLEPIQEEDPREDDDSYRVEYTRPNVRPPLPPRPQPREDDISYPGIRLPQFQQPPNRSPVPPKISSFSFANNMLNEGSRAVLTCSVIEGDLPVTLRWEKDGGSVPLYEGITTRNLNDYTTQLTIDRVSSRRHNGEYKCLASNRGGTTWHTATLRVNEISPPWPSPSVPPKISQFSFDRNMQNEGSRAVLTCSIIEGDLPVSFRWEKDGGSVPLYEGITIRNLDVYSSQLTINRVSSRPHNGEYTCLASNRAGTTWHTATLRVNDISPSPWPSQPVHPRISPFSFDSNMQNEGSRAVLTCSIIEGDLPLTLRWEKDGRTIPSYEGITTRNLDDHSTQLIIDRVSSHRHYGDYTCLASNRAGTSRYTATLNGLVHLWPIDSNFDDPNAPGEHVIPWEMRDTVDFVIGEGGVKCDTSCRGQCTIRDSQCRCMQNVTCFEMLKHRLSKPVPLSYVIPPGCPEVKECKHPCAYVVQWPDKWCMCHKDPICLQRQRRVRRDKRQTLRAERKSTRRAARISKRETQRKELKEARRATRITKREAQRKALKEAKNAKKSRRNGKPSKKTQGTSRD